MKLIYTDIKVITIIETNDNVLTPHHIFEANTKEECFDKIDELKIIYYYPLNKNEILLFSGGTRAIIQNPNNTLIV